MSRFTDSQKRSLERAAAILFALAVWQALAAAVGSAWLLASPVQTARVLFALLGQPSFWKTLAFSFLRIAGGFFAALLLGSLLAAAAGAFRAAELLLWPFLSAIKATPVASFIILCLIWLNSRRLSIFISFLMVLPVVYTNLLSGIRARDARLAEMARVFSIGRGTRLLYLDLPQLRPYLESACSVGVGLAWKAGIAAEVIGIPSGSLGERLYQAKIYLSTGELFAWTVAAVFCSVWMERLLHRLLGRFFDRLEAGVGRERAAAAQAQAQRLTAPITVDRVSKAFGGRRVLEEVSLTLPERGVLCLMAPSGAGKTTLARILLGLETPDAGSVSGLPARKAAVFQEDRLCERLTVGKNIRIACPQISDKALRCHLEAVGLAEHASAAAGKLSGGQKRRAAIVRAVAGDAPFLILDEPFAGLDEATHAQVIAYLRGQLADRCVFLITHDPKDAEALGAKIVRLR